jgi:multiple sugar transport system permease protein
MEFRGRKVVRSSSPRVRAPGDPGDPNYEIGRLFTDTLTAVIKSDRRQRSGCSSSASSSSGCLRSSISAIDGANTWQVFAKVLPPSRPARDAGPAGVPTNSNDFLWLVYVLFSPEMQTLQAGLSTLQSANNVRATC